MKRIKYDNQVYFVTDEFIEVNRGFIKDLKEKCMLNRNRKSRLCTHKNVDSLIHEMIIVHTKDTYVRPHKHINKIESFHVVEGLAKAVIFNEEGKIVKVSALGNYSSGRNFYWKFEAPYYHALIIESSFFVFHEITNGPFSKSETIFAPWSVEEGQPSEAKFMHEVRNKANKFFKSKGKKK